MTRDDPMLDCLLERLPADPELWRLVCSARCAEEERDGREWVELTGLLASTCAAEAPAGARERVLRACAGRPGAGSGAEVVSLAERRPVHGVGDRGGVGPAVSSRALWALAAALVVSVLALAVLAGRVLEQRSVIASLQAATGPTPGSSGTTAWAPAMAESALDDEARRLRDRLRMVTSVARYAYPLHRPASAGPAAPGGPTPAADRAGGTVFVCGAHQRWYLSIHDLDPPPPGSTYRLWFLTDDGPRGGRSLAVRPGELVELEATSLPDGTRGFAVSLEPEDRLADQEPLGTTVLLAEEPVSL